MPELGFIVYLIAMSYGMGVVWYTFLGRNHSSWMRMAAFPLIGVVIGESLMANYQGAGLTFFGLHIFVVLVSTLVAALVDVSISWIAKEHPLPFGHQEQAAR